MNNRASWRWTGGVPILPLVLTLSSILRLALAWSGGQRFFPDEGRYVQALKGLHALATGNFGQAAGSLLLAPSHQLFPLLSVPAASLQFAGIVFFGRPLLDYRLAASVFALISVGIIYLVYRLARVAGADETEALLAAGLAACANTLFYPSRHLLPYDGSMALCLLALLLVLDPRCTTRRAAVAGLVASVGALVYNGYYSLAMLAGFACLFSARPDLRRMLRISAAFVIGGCVPPLCLMLLAWRMGDNVLDSARAFAGTITQGDFAEGWELPFSYLWAAEGWISVLWAAACIGAIVLLIRREPGVSRVATWLAAAGLLYCALAISSTVLHRFVAYGRLVRQLTPFLCLTTAFVMHALLRKHRLGRIVAFVLLAAVITAGCRNFAPAFRIVFPREVFALVRSQYGVVREQSRCDWAQHYRVWFTNQPRLATPEIALRGVPSWLRTHVESRIESLEAELAQERSAAASTGVQSQYILLNADFPSFPAPAPCWPAPDGAVLARWPHPFRFTPFQYEGMSGDVRVWFRSLAYDMQLIDVGPNATN